MDLLDLWRGTMTPRRAAVLALNLPDGAQVWRHLGQANAWTLDQHFGRMVVDRLNVANWQRSKDGAEGRNQPEPLPSPGDESVVKADTAVAQALAFRARQAAKAKGGADTDE